MCNVCKLGIKVIEKTQPLIEQCRAAQERSRCLEEKALESAYHESTIPSVPRGRPADGYGDLGI